MTTQTFRTRAGRVSALAGAVLALGSFAFAGSASAVPSGSPVTAGGEISSPNSVDATTWPTTADCAAEWHWVITGLAGSSIDSTDVPSVVHVTWSDDSTVDVAFSNFTGNVAHYYEYTANIPPTLTVKSATAVWPNPTDVTAYNNFNLSHGPCVPEPTTTTVAETTTTVEETTTTVEETTTTVEETTTTVEETTTTVEETTTTVEDTTTTVEDTTTTEAPTTTVVEETTTSVASEVPTTVSRQSTTTTEEVASQSPGGELPATGSDASGLMLVGGLVLLAGGALAMALGRRTYHA